MSSRGDQGRVLTGATDDSRQVKPGNLFVAIKGEKFDGHAFIPQALAQGAAAIVAEHEVELPDDIPLLIVNQPYPAAARIAELAEGYPARDLKLLAVTGTNGKTTSAFLLREILRQAGEKTAMIGTVCYDLADDNPREADRTTPTPFALQNLFRQARDNHASYLVIEASSHALQQQRLGTAQADGAIFTNLTQDHLDYHQTLENYFQAKKRLFTHHLKKGAPIVINSDDPFGKRLENELASENPTSFSVKHLYPPVVVYVKDLKLSAQRTECALTFPDGNWLVESPLAGLYNGYNVAGVAILAHELGLPYPLVKQALATCPGAPGRLQKIDAPNHISIFVDYAHTPDALENVIQALNHIKNNRLITVFGCGGNRDKTKRPVMGRIAASLSDQVIVTSDNPRDEEPDDIIRDIMGGISGHPEIKTITDRKQAIREAIITALPHDIILIAGKGHEPYQEIKGVKHPYSDFAAIDEALKS